MSNTTAHRLRAMLGLAAIGLAAGCVPDPPVEPHPRTIDVAWGSPTSVAGCSVNCFRMVADLSGWPPNTPVAVRCEYHTGDGLWRDDFGFDPPDLVTDAGGNATTGDTPSSCVGSPSGPWEYRFIVDGRPSPPLG